MMLSYLSHLECSGCGKAYSHHELHTFCPSCQSTLLPFYDLKKVRQQVDRDEISRRKKGMWRWQEVLPVLHNENQIFLGEGDTPLLSLPRLQRKLGISNLYVKDESSNPTASFKARGLAAAISKAKEPGVEKVIIPTAGNAGGAMPPMLRAQDYGLISSCLKTRLSPMSKRVALWVRKWFWWRV